MKKWIVVFYLISGLAQATDLTVFDQPDNSLPDYNQIETALQVDTKTNQGFIRITGTRSYRVFHPRPHGGGYWQTMTVAVFEQTGTVPNLMLDGDKLVYRGNAGAVECATLRLSPIFKIPTLYMTGNCSATSKLVKVDGQNHLQVFFTSKP